MGNKFEIDKECLRDIGCSNEEIELFEKYLLTNNTNGVKKILVKRRNEVLSKIHENQNILCCIDYMLKEIE